MMVGDHLAERGPGEVAAFGTTHWSVVLAAGQRGSSQASAALEALCGSYWFPLHAWVRRRGHDADEARDLTQEFFARLLARNYLARAVPGPGRFRSFLLTGLQRFLCDEWDNRAVSLTQAPPTGRGRGRTMRTQGWGSICTACCAKRWSRPWGISCAT